MVGSVDKLVAAFHHAGHAVAAHTSRFHVVALPLRVDTYGGGDVVTALSRRKLLAAEKAAAASARSDPEVAASIATILCAGLVCERIAAMRTAPFTPDPTRSAGDFAMAIAELEQAGLECVTQPYEDAAAALLTDHWEAVQRIVDKLVHAEELAPDEINALILAEAAEGSAHN